MSSPVAAADAPGLRTRGVGVAFAGLVALDQVDLSVRRGTILGLIGPNGAGKTTLINVMSGYQRPSAGRLVLDGADITKLPPERLARRGVVRTFQAVRLFGRLTVSENVEAAALAGGLRPAAARHRTAELLATLGLTDQAQTPARALPYGDERRISLARALATGPRFLLLDEPAAGMDERESDELLHLVLRIRDEYDLGVLIVEHDMRLIMRLCDRVHVLAQGKTLTVGTPADVQRDPRVIAAYLGRPVGVGDAEG